MEVLCWLVVMWVNAVLYFQVKFAVVCLSIICGIMMIESDLQGDMIREQVLYIQTKHEVTSRNLL